MTLPEFTALEQAILAKAGDLEVTRKRIGAVWVSAAFFAVALVSFGFIFQDWRIVTGVAVIYILINTIERAAYGKAVLSYKMVIQKLLRHSEGQIGTGAHGR